MCNLQREWVPPPRPIITQWKSFLEKNEWDDSAASFFMFVSQMMRSRLKNSTLATYAEEVQEYRLRPADGEVTPRVVMKQLQLLAAVERRQHAPDRNIATLSQRIMSKTIDLINCGIGIALLCGLRAKDVSHLQGRQIKLEADSLKIDVRVAKNRRSQNQMTTLLISKDSPLWQEDLIKDVI